MVNCCVLSPLEATGTSGAVTLFPPLENGGADVSVLVLVIFEGYLSLPTLYIPVQVQAPAPRVNLKKEPNQEPVGRCTQSQCQHQTSPSPSAHDRK